VELVKRHAAATSRVSDLLTALALFCATAVYAVAREGLVLHDWLEAWLGSGGTKRLLSPRAMRMPTWVAYSLPDGLWAFALCLAMLRIWRGARWSPLKGVACGFAASAGVVVELLQRWHVLPGTYDPVDVLLCVLGAAVAFMADRALTGASFGRRTTAVH
jgi:hypothetical protein